MIKVSVVKALLFEIKSKEIFATHEKSSKLTT